MESETTGEERGWPIYRDPIDRKLPDPARASDTDWYPATPATRKLWRCFESMQKLHFVLQGRVNVESQDATRRLLIQFVVPLYDFFICVRDLGRVINGDDQARSGLKDGEQAYVIELMKRYDFAVLHRVLPLKTVRDKLGAHTDTDIWPDEAAKLVDDLEIHMVGAYLHAALLALDKLARLDCYAWTSKGYREGEVRLMTCEPIVISFRTEEMGDLVGFETTESPKRHIHEKIADLVELSTWMFADGQGRLIVKRGEHEAAAS